MKIGRAFRNASLAAALAYAGVGAALWSYQRHLIFEPSRVMHAKPADFAFPVVDASVPLPSGRVHGWWLPGRRGEARTVLYLHGNDGNVSTSIAEIAPLQRLGYSIFLIDYRGFGRSDGAFPSEKSVYEDADAAWAHLVKERNIAAKNLYIYGHSLGGAVAIELAARHPEAAGLIVESSFTSIYDMTRLEKQYAIFPVKLLLDQKFESIAKVPRLRLPVLFIHGTHDEVVPYAMGKRLYESARGEKRFVAIRGGGHETNAAVGGEGFVSAIRDFLDDTQRGLNSSSI